LVIAPKIVAQPVVESQPQQKTEQWVVTGEFAIEAIGVGLPPLELQKKGWSSFLQGRERDSRARASGVVQVWANSPQGWRFGWLKRTEAWLTASEGTVRAAAYDDQGTDPSKPQNFAIAAHWHTWSGAGLQLGTPWMPLVPAQEWKWRASVQGLKLGDFQSLDMDGNIQYQGDGQYDVQSTYSRVSPKITTPFVVPSATSGWGGSLSFEMAGNLAHNLELLVVAQDVASRLRWRNLPTDNGEINTQNVQKNEDGTLDYAPRINGRKFLGDITSTMGPRFVSRLRWTPQAWVPMTLLVDQKAATTLVWMGIEMGALRLQLEPRLRLAKLAFKNNHWNLGLGTDGRLQGSGYQFIQLSYSGSL
jgi:hypothetical protein